LDNKIFAIWVRSPFPWKIGHGHSTLSTAEVKNEWRCTSTPLYAFIAYEGIPYTFRPCMKDIKTSSVPKHKISEAHPLTEIFQF